jgi:hypothetical protein
MQSDGTSASGAAHEAIQREPPATNPIEAEARFERDRTKGVSVPACEQIAPVSAPRSSALPRTARSGARKSLMKETSASREWQVIRSWLLTSFACSGWVLSALAQTAPDVSAPKARPGHAGASDVLGVQPPVVQSDTRCRIRRASCRRPFLVFSSIQFSRRSSGSEAWRQGYRLAIEASRGTSDQRRVSFPH